MGTDIQAEQAATRPVAKGRAQRARSAAVGRLVAAHQDEYDKLHKEERVKLGLSAIPTTGSKLSEGQKKERKLARLREQIKALEGSEQ